MAPNTNSGAIFSKLKIVYISNFIIFDPEISSYCDKRQFFPFPRCVKNGRQRVDLGQLSPPQDHDVALCMYRRARSFHVIYACCVRSWSHQNRDPPAWSGTRGGGCGLRNHPRFMHLALSRQRPAFLFRVFLSWIQRVERSSRGRFTRNGPAIVLMDVFNVGQIFHA